MKSISNKIKSVFQNPWALSKFFINRGLLDFLGDEAMLKLQYRSVFGKKLDLENPKTFNEKLQWLKLYDRNPEYTNMVDKYLVREYIADKIGKEYLIPLIGVWNSPDEIDFEKLPDKFVLKCNHNSGGVVVCRDKSKLDIKSTKESLRKHLKKNYYSTTREWPYKSVKPVVIAEKYMTDGDGNDEFTDYKFFCFDGCVDCVMICLDRSTGDTKFYFFDSDWNLKRLNKRGLAAPEGFTLQKPPCMDEMFNIAAKLSEGIPFLRVDLYQSNGKIYFGELTFFPDSGLDPNLLPQTDEYFGSLIKLTK